MNKHSILQHCAFFRGIDNDAMHKLQGMSRLVKFDKGASIFRQGDRCPGIYAVGEGAVRVFKIAPSGKEHLIHLAEPGMTFAEVAVIGRFDCPAHAEALTDCTCALLPRDAFLQALANDHQLCMQLMNGMAWWVQQLVGLLEDLVLRDAAGRVARHLLRHAEVSPSPDFALNMMKKDLANHLNLTSETLSRTLRRFTESGLVETLEGQKLKLLDKSGLEAVAAGNAPRL